MNPQQSEVNKLTHYVTPPPTPQTQGQRKDMEIKQIMIKFLQFIDLDKLF
jgi:hypothetical protein